MTDKLENALAHYEAKPLEVSQPYFDCSRTRIVNSQLVELGLTPVPRKTLGFGNALVQNVASGNTMVLNLALLEITCLIDPQNSVLHARPPTRM